MTRLPATSATRRAVLMLAAGGMAYGLLPGQARALSQSEASTLVTRLVNDINSVINSGRSGTALYREFERLFERYADTDVIAASTLGPDWRTASDSQKRAYAEAFGGYIARKYGRRFREFAGGRIEVTRSTANRSGFEVEGRALLPGRGPINVTFFVSDRNNTPRFYDIFIEGIGLRTSERREIGALLDQRRGNLDELIAYLRTI